MPQTKLAPANRVAFLEQLSDSIAEINQPICAVVMNAEAALQLLRAQPTDTEAVRRLLARIVKDGLRTGDMVHRARALIKENAATEGMPGINAVTLESMKKLVGDVQRTPILQRTPIYQEPEFPTASSRAK